MHITAIFATMNRAATAVGCVRALAAQTRPPDRVIVTDNVSSDSTVADLEALCDLPFPLEVIRMAENAGNAGGSGEAMERAFSRGADAVWILDDDSWPRPGALAALLADGWDGGSVRHAHQVDPKTGRFTWPLQVRETGRSGGGWRMVWDEADLGGGDFVESRISWTGALVSREVRDAAGPVMADLFIRGEDEEYPLRIARAGYRFFACRNAVMDHPGPPDLVVWRLFGKRLFFERGLADWKLYYKVRNMVWLQREYHGNAKAALMALAYAAAVLRFDGVRRLRLVAGAVRDGWSGRLGKMPGQPAADSRGKPRIDP